MGCNKRIKSKMRKMTSGGDPLSLASLGNQYTQLMSNGGSIPQYGFGGWIKENKEGIMGGLTTVGGGLLTAVGTGLIGTGVGAPLGAALAGSGIGMMGKGVSKIGGEISDGNQVEMAEQEKRANMLAQQQANLAPSVGQGSYTQLMPNGGQVGSELVELEQGEPFRLPDGTIESIPTSAPTHKQGGVPIELPHGTKVLGKKKAKNGKQFKQLGRKLERLQKSHDKALSNNPTGLAARTSKRMLDNINNEYSKLFEEQGVDVGGNMMPNGGAVYKGDPRIQTYGYTPEQYRMAQDKDVLSKTPFYDPNTKEFLGYKTNRKNVSGPTYEFINNQDDKTGTFTFNNKKLITGSEIPEFGRGGMSGIRKGWGGLEADGGFDLYEQDLIGSGAPLATPTTSNVGYTPMLSQEDIINLQNNTFTTPSKYTRSNLTANEKPLSTEKVGDGFDWSSAMNTAGALAPVAYNLYQGSRGADKLYPEQFANPYEASSRSLMRGRRYNIQPELESANLATATLKRNLRESGLSKGQLLGGYQSASLANTRAKAEAIARQQNMNNQYLADQAGFDYRVGSDISNRKLQIRDINMRNQAAAKNMTSTGLSQLSQYSQMKELQNNQIARDAQRLGLLPALIQNFSYTQDGGWIFNATGQPASEQQVANFLKTQG